MCQEERHDGQSGGARGASTGVLGSGTLRAEDNLVLLRPDAQIEDELRNAKGRAAEPIIPLLFLGPPANDQA
jgi:hypothetical protein